jgi:hypothetical protein
VAALACAGSLAGCVTTQQEAARIQLDSARIRASEAGTRVTVAGATVRVTDVSLVRSARGTAFVVDVHNPGARAVDDLPISVGVRVATRRPRYLNDQTGLRDFYFDTHLPVIAAHRTLTWVYASGGRVPAGARPFAIVGGRPSPSVPIGAELPVIVVAARGATASGTLSIAVRNRSGIPQYQVPVFAFARSGSRYIAAGDATVVTLGGQASETVHLGLLGSLNHARLQIEALPTIFQ